MSFIFGSEQSVFHLAFGEHRRSILNHSQLINPQQQFNQPAHSINGVLLFLWNFNMYNNCNSVTKTSEAHLIDRALTLDPRGSPLEGLFCKLKYRANTF